MSLDTVILDHKGKSWGCSKISSNPRLNRFADGDTVVLNHNVQSVVFGAEQCVKQAQFREWTRCRMKAGVRSHNVREVHQGALPEAFRV